MSVTNIHKVVSKDKNLPSLSRKNVYELIKKFKLGESEPELICKSEIKSKNKSEPELICKPEPELLICKTEIKSDSD